MRNVVANDKQGLSAVLRPVQLLGAPQHPLVRLGQKKQCSYACMWSKSTNNKLITILSLFLILVYYVLTSPFFQTATQLPPTHFWRVATSSRRNVFGKIHENVDVSCEIDAAYNVTSGAITIVTMGNQSDPNVRNVT